MLKRLGVIGIVTGLIALAMSLLYSWLGAAADAMFRTPLHGGLNQGSPSIFGGPGFFLETLSVVALAGSGVLIWSSTTKTKGVGILLILMAGALFILFPFFEVRGPNLHGKMVSGFERDIHLFPYPFFPGLVFVVIGLLGAFFLTRYARGFEQRVDIK